MAKVPTFSLIVLLFLAISLPTNSQEFSTKVPKRELQRSERLIRLRFFLRESIRGDAPSALVVAQAPTTPTYRYNFGRVLVFDDPLTEGPNLSSRAVGRAQGLSTYADVRETGLLMVYNYFFTEGRYNDSTLQVMGRNAPRSDVRDLSVLSGTGRLRGARGYVRLRAYSVDIQRGYFVDEHLVFLILP
ncbi:dirigent protein 21-like [Salvia hispanica]|uniref:dirigent protein 21-like n=1 Tax=Salvia hispanica TaxID=49212 RepID=UPI0020093F45|nr:dirigent protein 21-like [Salvia hispanica]